MASSSDRNVLAEILLHNVSKVIHFSAFLTGASRAFIDSQGDVRITHQAFLQCVHRIVVRASYLSVRNGLKLMTSVALCNRISAILSLPD